jgi:Rieske Fe-S protein
MIKTCEVCGNEYDKTFEVTFDGRTHVFDSFECAIHALAPKCDHCGCRVIGHGHQVEGKIYCCAHCGHMAGKPGFVDRLDDVPAVTR